MTTNESMTEAELQAAIVEVARLRGYLVYHTHDSRRSEPGFPDLVLAHPAKGVLFIECKRENGKLSEPQIRWFETLSVGGSDVWVTRPSSLDSMLQRL